MVGDATLRQILVNRGAEKDMSVGIADDYKSSTCTDHDQQATFKT